ncbi:MAG: ABC transporter permease [Methylobacteriaceae bacterium]|jgi:peptide/nickel transport system permease protein|nr:ABC transporter permease [Methylobacteriaceae bacterium]
MSTPSASLPSPVSWREWLLTSEPQSRRQARLGRYYRGWLAFSRNPSAMFGLAIVLMLVLCAVFAPWIAPYDPERTLGLQTARLLPPSAQNWLGTDIQGFDVFSRLINGSRFTLMAIFIVAIITTPIGLLIGTFSGYYGGIVDAVFMRITDVFLAFPRLVLAMALVGARGPGLENAIFAISVTAWPAYARIARAETLTIRNNDYIAAIRLQGASSLRIIFGHIIPLCLSSVIVRVTLDMAGIIIVVAGLGFLGIGAQPPTPEWGTMVSAAKDQMRDYPWIITSAGLAICVVSLGFNLLGDGLRDVLDPKSARN